MRCIRYGFGIKSNIGWKSKITKEKNASFIHKRVQIRELCRIIIRKNAKLVIGDNLFCNRNVFITCQSKIIIGHNVIIGPNVVIVDHNHDYSSDDMKNKFICEDTIIGDDVWIGANVTIAAGAKIANGAIIGANSVVTGEVGAKEIWGGTPAKFIKKIL